MDQAPARAARLSESSRERRRLRLRKLARQCLRPKMGERGPDPGPSAECGKKVLSKRVQANDLRHHRDEFRVVANRTRSLHPDPRLTCDPGCLNVEIIKNLDVITQKSNRDEHADGPSFELLQRETNLRFEPWVSRTSAAALEREGPRLDAKPRGH